MSFKDIIGHTKEISVLAGSLANGRVPHALLFSGPEGVGKRLVALEFARALNCREFRGGSSGDSCGRCPDCALFDSGTHPNLTLAGPTDKDGQPSPEGLIRIEPVREIQNSLKYRVERGSKAVIIDSADRMMPAAANAFLKTLEEPPADSVIMLVTSRSSDLLPTIISRCQRMNFRPLSSELVTRYLVEKTGAAEADAVEAARLAAGSISKALFYASEGGYGKKKEIAGAVSAITPADTDAALSLAAELSKRDDLVDVLEFLKTWYRDMLVGRSGAVGLMVNSGACADAGSDERRLMDSFSMIERARRDIMPPRYANRQLTMEVLLLGLAGCRGV
ncbi:MAG TPA: DNA polymerase III subunit delta' [Thermodesulfobacteriota bacterium]|nr:DNA polymerase III subunit delta' [Thermodesulfobacteriota bacterium]